MGEKINMSAVSKYERSEITRRPEQAEPVKEGPKKWGDMTEAEVNAFKNKVCRHCEYLTTTYGKRGFINRTICEYNYRTGSLRPCSPLECEEKGIFVQKTRKKRPYCPPFRNW